MFNSEFGPVITDEEIAANIRHNEEMAKMQELDAFLEHYAQMSAEECCREYLDDCERNGIIPDLEGYPNEPW